MAAHLVTALALLVSAGLVPVAGQPATQPAGGQHAPQSPYLGHIQAAMRKIEWLEGRWEGTATFPARGGQRVPDVHQHELVQMKVNGTVLHIEGTGRALGADGQPGEVVFQAMAVLTFDPMSKAYSMRTFTEMGSSNPTVEVGEKELTWGFTAGPPGSQRMIRYHIRLDERGEWHETGQMSADGGKTWMPTIEMRLHRIGDAKGHE